MPYCTVHEHQLRALQFDLGMLILFIVGDTVINITCKLFLRMCMNVDVCGSDGRVQTGASVECVGSILANLVTIRPLAEECTKYVGKHCLYCVRVFGFARFP